MKLPRLKLLQLCRAINSCSDLWSGQGLKQSCNYRRELFNGVSHATCTHTSRIDSQHFVVGSQTANLTPALSFCHNLCCRCPNGSCEPIWNIYASINFQWYKELLNARCFDLCNRSLKVRESTKTPIPKMGAHLGVILTLSHTPRGPRSCKLLPWSRAQG
jgi:hypothetical protein